MALGHLVAIILKFSFTYRVVLEALAHLLAISRQDQPIANDVLEGGLVEERGREHHESVEPSARLIQPLGNEVCRESSLKYRYGSVSKVYSHEDIEVRVWYRVAGSIFNQINCRIRIRDHSLLYHSVLGHKN